MDINTFLTLFDQKQKNDDGLEYLKTQIKNVYVPFEKKVAVAKAIVNTAFYRNRESDGGVAVSELYIDSPAKYMLTCMTLIDLYTNIERAHKDNKTLDEFNELNRRGIFDALISIIDERELKEFNMIVRMTADDVMANEYENHAFIKSQVKRFSDLLGTALAPILEEIDVNQIKELLTSHGKNKME